MATVRKDRPSVSFIDWDPSDHVERIVISPYAEKWQSDTIKELVRRLNPSLGDRVFDSKMGIDLQVDALA